jgi:hypothetical protein
MTSKRFWIAAIQLCAISFLASFAVSQTPSPALRVLEKDDKALAIVDPATLKIVARVPAGEDRHEVVASQDGNRATISHYGGFRTPQKTLSVVGLFWLKALAPIDLGPPKAPLGLDILNDKVYFTTEGSKLIGCYDPATKQVELLRIGNGLPKSGEVTIGSRRLNRADKENIG